MKPAFSAFCSSRCVALLCCRSLLSRKIRIHGKRHHQHAVMAALIIKNFMRIIGMHEATKVGKGRKKMLKILLPPTGCRIAAEMSSPAAAK